MLSKVETLYLNLLRGFILLVATLALIAAAGAAVMAVPSLIERFGEPQADTSALSLSNFINEQKPQTGTSPSADAPVDEGRVPVDPQIAKAAANIHSYLGSRTDVRVKDWEQGLQSSLSEVPAGAHSDYKTSLVSLSEELKMSSGKPLSQDRVVALLTWHQQRFVAAWEQEAANKLEADARFKMQLYVASAAFMFFILIAFVFLFVRMERNTRVVRVIRVHDDA